MNPYLLPYLPPERPYTWLLTVDPNKRHGGLLTAIDHEDNRYYVAEHYAEGLPDGEHARRWLKMLGAFKLRHGRDCTVYADPGGAGAQAIINVAELGIIAQPVPKDAGSVKASIERVRRAAWVDPGHWHPLARDPRIRDDQDWRHCFNLLGAPHCYFLTSLRSAWKQDGVEYAESRLMWELRQYRQKRSEDGRVAKPDEPIKEHDDLVDCMRYVELVRPFAPAGDDEEALQVARERSRLDSLSKKASDEFDDLVKRAQQPQRREAW